MHSFRIIIIIRCHNYIIYIGMYKYRCVVYMIIIIRVYNILDIENKYNIFNYIN